MIGLYAFAIAIIFEMSPELNEGLELVPFPNDEFQQNIAIALGLDFILCYGIEKLCKWRYLATFKDKNDEAWALQFGLNNISSNY